MIRFLFLLLTSLTAMSEWAWASEQEFVLRNGEVRIPLKWGGDINDQVFLEVSKSKKFNGSFIKKFRVTGNEFTLTLKETGAFYWRIQKRNRDREPASIRSFVVVGMSVLPPPQNIRFAKGYEYQDKILIWDKVDPSSRYMYQIYDYQKKQVIRSEIVTEGYEGEHIWGSFLPDWARAKKKPRYYFARVATISKDGQVGPFSSCLKTRIGQSKRKWRGPRASRVDFCQQRAPAAVASTRISAPVEPQYFGYNQAYKNSLIQFEGASFLMGSVIDQPGSDSIFAAAMTTSIRGLWWMNRRFGFEGLFKSKVAGYNELGNGVSPFWVEGRAHMRWKFKPIIFKKTIREFQFSISGGYEFYKNEVASDLNFTTGYSVFKGGTALRIPLWENWEAGGEAYLGYGLDQSTKIEMHGYLNYYYKKHWSLGTGYKVHLFGAGTADQAPDGVLPYREGYIEILGNLRYSF